MFLGCYIFAQTYAFHPQIADECVAIEMVSLKERIRRSSSRWTFKEQNPHFQVFVLVRASCRVCPSPDEIPWKKGGFWVNCSGSYSQPKCVCKRYCAWVFSFILSLIFLFVCVCACMWYACVYVCAYVCGG